MTITVKYSDDNTPKVDISSVRQGQLFYFSLDERQDVYIRTSHDRYVSVRTGGLFAISDYTSTETMKVFLLKGTLTVEEMK